MRIAYDAMMFAREAHKNQKRKYTGNPYTDHLAEVAGITASVAPSITASVDHMQVMIATAWLHDYIEDINPQEGGTWGWWDLDQTFGTPVADAVRLLSDLETGNRAERKEKSRIRLAGAPAWVQTIKVADLISNTSSIVQHDPKFAVVYLEEKRLLLDVLTKADPRLVKIARAQAEAA